MLSDTRAVHATTQEFTVWLLGLAAACLVSGLLVLAYLIYGLGRPFSRMAALMVRLLHGDLGVGVPGQQRKDELGEVARALAQFKEVMVERQQRTERHEKALRDLRETQEHLIQAAKMASLSQLVAGIAHGMSSPVSVMVTGASKLAEEVVRLRSRFFQGRLRKSEFRDFVENADDLSALLLSNSQRAAELIVHFKQLAAEPAAAEFSTFRLRPFLEDVLAGLAPGLESRGHRILLVSCPHELAITSCAGAVTQVLGSLAANAEEHAFDEGKAGEITVSVRPVDDRQIELVLADNGRGMAPDVLPRIFDPFFTRRRRTGSSGLGLYIVYNTVNHLLQGRITASSTEGRGSTFTIVLPLTPRN